MDIITRSRMIGQFDPSEIKNFLFNLPEEDWTEFSMRQQNFESHKDTNTICAIFPDRSQYPQIKCESFKHTEALMKLLEPLSDAFVNFYDDKPFVCTTAIFVKLAPGKDIGAHSDTHPYFGVSHRLHWCIDGDYDNMHFMIAGGKVAMYEGDFIEINNRLPHSVKYAGDRPRLNAIIDFMEVPPE